MPRRIKAVLKAKGGQTQYLYGVPNNQLSEYIYIYTHKMLIQKISVAQYKNKSEWKVVTIIVKEMWAHAILLPHVLFIYSSLSSLKRLLKPSHKHAVLIIICLKPFQCPKRDSQTSTPAASISLVLSLSVCHLFPLSRWGGVN